jgi:hypothetical protein
VQPTVQHVAHDRLDVVVRRDGHHVARHDVFDGEVRGRRLSPLRFVPAGERAHQIGLGDDAHDVASIVLDRCAADVLGGEELLEARDGELGAHREDVLLHDVRCAHRRLLVQAEPLGLRQS